MIKRRVIKRKDDALGVFFVAGLFLGLGADFYYQSWPVGLFVGMGVGFLLMALANLIRR